jgi:hypothetical protein
VISRRATPTTFNHSTCAEARQIRHLTMQRRLVLWLSVVSFAPFVASDSSDAGYRSNTCLPRNVGVYTSASQTYFLTDLGSMSFAPSPSFCPNVTASTSTVYSLGVSTVTERTTVVQQASPSTSASGSIADNGFEGGDDTPFNTSASAQGVDAAVEQGGQGSPFQPFAGDSYL